MTITAVILTLNEAEHLPRCMESLRGLADEVVVVDCYSSDDTVHIAERHGAQVLQREWVNHADQFNWALTQLGPDTGWVLRIDADEYLTPALADEIRERLPDVDPEVDGVNLGRRIVFKGKAIRHGGLFPARVLRLFRHGQGRCENRWMDEHIKVKGTTVDFAGELIDENLNSLTWWIDKHNQYASREAVDLLNLEFGFMPLDSVASFRSGSQAGFKRWIKESVYVRMPGGLRAFLYFLYRYVLRLGFLDGRVGLTYHVLQGFWYRFLVDAKVAEVRQYMRKTDTPVVQSIDAVLGIRIEDAAGQAVPDVA